MAGFARAAAQVLKVQVAVVGGGVMGAATAWALAKRGTAAALIEQHASETHTLGSSHGDGRIARLAYAEDYYVELMRHSYELWADLERATGSQLVRKCGSLDFGPRGSKNLADLRASYAKNRVPFETLTHETAARRFPQFRFSADDEILFQADGSVVFASAAVAALWQAAVQHKSACVTALRGDGVASIELGARGGEHVLVLQSGRRISAQQIVLSAGAWTNKLLAAARLAPLPLVVTDEQVNYFALRASAGTTIDHSFASMPTYICHDITPETPLGFYGIPNVPTGLDGVKVAVMSRGPVLADPSVRTLRTDPALLELVQSFVRRRFTSLNPLVSTSLRCLYTTTPDRDFIIGLHPDHADVVVASPCSGHGFKMAPAVGEILADGGTSTRHDMRWYAPARFNEPDSRRDARTAA